MNLNKIAVSSIWIGRLGLLFIVMTFWVPQMMVPAVFVGLVSITLAAIVLLRKKLQPEIMRQAVRGLILGGACLLIYLISIFVS